MIPCISGRFHRESTQRPISFGTLCTVAVQPRGADRVDWNALRPPPEPGTCCGCLGLFARRARTPDRSDVLRLRRDILQGIRARLEEEYGVDGIERALAWVRVPANVATDVRGLLEATRSQSTDALDVDRTRRMVESSGRLLHLAYWSAQGWARLFDHRDVAEQDLEMRSYALAVLGMNRALKDCDFPGSTQLQSFGLRELRPHVRAAVHEEVRARVRAVPVVQGWVEHQKLVVAVDGAIADVARRFNPLWNHQAAPEASDFKTRRHEWSVQRNSAQPSAGSAGDQSAAGAVERSISKGRAEPSGFRHSCSDAFPGPSDETPGPAPGLATAGTSDVAGGLEKSIAAAR
ncbi:hypothetical protein JI739_10420 [Ramlibacter sp. AW1]|uniref:Uncharacterized protein n=1 Tax=Ramlibacter aurantiacus TaxID=2801330 RepID=A0A937D6A6_9BURK|nr:hypothetical protein [Ramlibacter aurantiacus]MBL0420758.1 hypothetical protein [Ramlibacter aurantiacus]